MNYPGGKNGSGTYQKIINLIPPHAVYVEAFLGSGAILRMKRPASRNIGIDADAAVIASWGRGEYRAVPNLQLHCGDAIKWLAEHRNSLGQETFVYCDPPYLMETRSSKRQLYLCELGQDEEHVRLLDILTELSCMVMISGYESALYARLLAGWRLTTFQAITRGGNLATECVWCNFPEPMELHDYQYLGNTYRERERIKRKQARWRKRLAEMPAQERYALLAELENLRGVATPSTAMSAGEHRQNWGWLPGQPSQSDQPAEHETNCVTVTNPGTNTAPRHETVRFKK